jgi:O-antigen/teichoic acid export membrane protein
MDNEFISKTNQTIKKFFYSSFLKATGIYTLANFANAAIPFFLMPVLTRYLAPADYGIIAVFGVLIGLCTPFIGLNTHFAITLKYFKIDKPLFPQYVSSCLLITLLSFLTTAVFFSIFKSEISKISGLPEEWLWSVVIICFCASITAILSSIFFAAVKPYPYGIVQFSRTVLTMGLSIYFVVWLNMNWQGWLVAQVVSAVIFAAISLYLLSKNQWIVFKYSIDFVKGALKFGVPLLPSNLAMFAMVLADRVIITELRGLSETGIYFVGIQFYMVVWLVISSINNAFQPWLFNQLNNATETIKSKIVLISYMYIAAAVIFGIFSSWVMAFVLKFWVDPRFFGATEVLFWACLAQVFNGMWTVAANYIFYAEKTHMELWITIPVAAFHLTLCYFLVEANGIKGAAQAAAIAYFIKMVFGIVLSNKLYPMPWISFYKNGFNFFKI